MEYISEQPIRHNGKLCSAIRFEKVTPERFEKIVDGYKTDATSLIALSISKNDIASVLFDPLNENDRTLFAGFLCRSFTLMDLFEDLLNRAKSLKEANF
jgi:transcriptional regulator NrdR family protein